jgi:hypothetical protein
VLFLCVTPTRDGAQGRFARYPGLLNYNRPILLFFSEYVALPSEAVALTPFTAQAARIARVARESWEQDSRERATSLERDQEYLQPLTEPAVSPAT